MQIKCPKCQISNQNAPGSRNNISRYGSFHRSSDRKKAQRYFCKTCGLHFSSATRSSCYRQKKRQLNHKVARLLVAGVSQREGHKILKINRKTFVRKFVFMANKAQLKLAKLNSSHSKSSMLEFDDLETFEHTKCKPLSITLAVEEKSRRILGFEVSQMPAKGHLAAIARKKYGFRKDLRAIGRAKLFKTIKPLVTNYCQIKSDENPHYVWDVKRFFPKSEHKRYLGKRGAITGQGELKKVGFDPLFDLNHTCATLRARMNRLFRRTWCTTKKPERLVLHLALTALHHNLNLKPSTI